MSFKVAISALASFYMAGCSVASDMKHMLHSTDHVAKTSDDMAQDTHSMRQSTDDVAGTSHDMAKDTKAMRQSTDHVAQTSDELNAKTDKLSQTSDSLNDKTGKVLQTSEAISAKTDGLASATGNLYGDLRQGDAVRIRGEALAQMDRFSDQVAKLSAAGHYFMAFEFQLWKNNNRDNAKSLDVLRRDAVDEFLRTAHEYIPQDHSLSPASTDNKMKGLYALVAAMDSINSNSVAEFPEADSLGGMQELLRRGLASMADVDNGRVALSSLPEYQQMVQKFAPDALYLLKMRVNFIPGLIVNTLASDDAHTQSWLELAGLEYGQSWTAHVPVQHVAQLTSYNLFMAKVAATRAALRSIGQEAPIDGDLRNIIAKMRFDAGDLVSPNPTRSQLVTSLRQAFQDFLK